MARVVALLTGRGNNTLKDKNVLPVFGKPLLYYPSMAAIDSGVITDFYVSSDDVKILNAAAALGYEKIVRPEELARPDSQHVDTIKHSLRVIEERTGQLPDIIIVFLANSPTVHPDWVRESVEMLLAEPDLSAVVPVHEDNDHHPFRAKKLDKTGCLDTFFDFSGKQVSTNRQDLEPCYFLCHNFWALRVSKSIYAEGGQQPWSFMGDKVKPIMVSECFDVHTAHDLDRSEIWLKKHFPELND